EPQLNPSLRLEEGHQVHNLAPPGRPSSRPQPPSVTGAMHTAGSGTLSLGFRDAGPAGSAPAAASSRSGWLSPAPRRFLPQRPALPWKQREYWVATGRFAPSSPPPAWAGGESS